ncbi:transcriptional regulator [Bradyrhizobium sp.]|uniref:transcriptional regulator n=1 Tax=Bradyrhizobium sp. TaxID=376 RepID=UPI003BAE36E9
MGSQFDSLLLQPTRFEVVGFLLSRASGRAPFVEICRSLGIEHYSILSAHARALERARYLTQQKSFVNRKPQTELVLTNEGREAFARHLARLDALTQELKQDSHCDAVKTGG